MKGFVKGQHINNILGTPKVMGRLSDEHIRDFYIMQKLDGFGKEAVIELMRTENKTREEIETICGIRQEDNNLITPEIKAAILADAEKGMTAEQIACKYHMNVKTVGYHITKARKQGAVPSLTQIRESKPADSIKEEEPIRPAEEISWYAMSSRLEMFAEETFGHGLRFVCGKSSDPERSAELEFITPQGKKVKIIIEELGE